MHRTLAQGTRAAVTHTRQLFARSNRRVAGLLLVYLTCAGSVVFAEDTTFINPLGDITLYDFLFKILNALIYILFPVIVLMIVYTGFLFVAAQGNPAKIEEARRALVWTVIGAVVLLGAKAIALAVQATVDDLTIVPLLRLIA